MGDGGFSVVKKGVYKANKMAVAIKEIKKSKVGADDVKREVDIWKLASKSSDRVVQLFGVYEDPDNIYLVMEIMKGGELFDKIVSMQDYSERYASTIIKQVLCVIQDLHRVHIIHQDMKPENLLLEDKDSHVIKLCDFGLAEIANDDVELVGLAGSTPYMAPEVIEGVGHSKPVDLYAAGVIAYILLCGYPPFEPENGIVDLEFPSPEWDQISDVAKDLITKLLSSNPESRPSAEEALVHPWFKDVETIKITSKPLFRTMDTLRRFQEMKGKPSTSMRQYRGQRGSVLEVFKEEPAPTKNSHPEKKEEVAETVSTTVVEGVMHNFKQEMAKSKERMLQCRKDTSALKVKLSELSATRQDVEMRISWELDVVRKEAEGEKKKIKSLQTQVESLNEAKKAKPAKKTTKPTKV
uniref:non-specific serine/threonine protein kinase n=1 Tax=Arcella intermedia TaxID=1963864 RepID=A0A6B2L5M6_9EUKA